MTTTKLMMTIPKMKPSVVKVETRRKMTARTPKTGRRRMTRKIEKEEKRRRRKR